MLPREVDLELGRDKGWKHLETHDRKYPDFNKERIEDVEEDSDENMKKKEKSYTEIFCHIREYKYHHEQNV